MRAIFWKEMADHFGRRRFIFLLTLVIIGFFWGWFVAAREIEGGARSTDEFIFLQLFTNGSGVLPPLLFFVSFFGPLVGIILGFDAINSERTQGTLSRILAQPVFRDAVFNGKFLAGLTTLAIIIVSLVLAVVGLAMFLLGLAPKGEEVLRLFGFTVLAITYISLWLALAMTCSIIFRNTVTSALVAVGFWLFTTFFLALLIAPALADVIVGEVETEAEALRQFRIEQWVARISPSTLFDEATGILLSPLALAGRTLGPVFALGEGTARLLSTPISATQSLRLVWPHIVAIISMVALLVGISYTKFMREEIRS